MDNHEIRRKILEFIYKKNEESPRCLVSQSTLKEHLSITEIKLDNAVLYLEEKYYLKLMKHLGSNFSFASITSNGIDLIENPNEFNSQFPISVTHNVIHGNTGVIIGDGNTQTINISDSFKDLYDEIERKNPTNKSEIISNIKNIEGELNSSNSNMSVISSAIKFLKEHSDWVIPTLSTIIQKSMGL